MTIRKLTVSSLLGFHPRLCRSNVGSGYRQQIPSHWGRSTTHPRSFPKDDEAEQAHHQLGGHGKKAKELLEQANGELKEAAGYLDHQHH